MSTPTPPVSDMLTTTEVATALGVTPKTVRRWVEAGSLPAIRTPGNHRRFRRSDVDALLAPAAQGEA